MPRVWSLAFPPSVVCLTVLASLCVLCPQAVHELESERPVLTKNPLIRDQHNVVIDKGDASHRRWLGGEGDHTTGNVFERQRQGTSARLSSAHDAVLR